MRSRSVVLGIAALLAGPVGCSETPPPVAPLPPPVAPLSIAELPSPAVDLSPVAVPAGIFMTVRWKNPGATLSALSSCAGVPVQLADNTARLLVDKALGEALRGRLDGQQLGEAVTFDAPVDLVMSLGTGKRGQPEPLYAFSIGLTSLERVKSAVQTKEPLTELSPGLWRIGEPGAKGLSCVFGPSAGTAPARIICGQHDKDVVALAPYLARNVAVAPPPSTDFHAELRYAPIDERYGEDLRRGFGLLPTLGRSQRIGEPRFDRALDEAAAGLADEGAALANELDRITLDLGVESGSCLTATSTFQLKGQKSWLAGTLMDQAAHTGPPPPLFWRAPKDSESAAYARSGDVTRYSGILRTLRGLLEGKLAKEKIGTEADRKALGNLLAVPWDKDRSLVIATGHGSAPGPRSPGESAEKQTAEALASSYLGWELFGIDERPESLTKVIKEAVSVYGRKPLLEPVRRELGHGADSLPRVKLVPPPVTIGKGALDVEVRFEADDPAVPSGTAKPQKVTLVALHVLLMPDGTNTWIGVGADRDDLARHLLMSKTRAPESGTLASRPGLDALRDAKGTSNGFLTLATFAHAVDAALHMPGLNQSGSAKARAQDMSNTLTNLPHKGETPIFLNSTVVPGDGPRSEFSLKMQKASFEDLGAILMTTLRIATNAGLLPKPQPQQP